MAVRKTTAEGGKAAPPLKERPPPKSPDRRQEAKGAARSVARKFIRGLVLIMLCLAAIGLATGGYSLYLLYQDLQLMREELSEQGSALTKLNEGRLFERLNGLTSQLDELRGENGVLTNQLEIQQTANSLLSNRLNNLEEEVLLLDAETLGQQRLRELIYLAEQRRQLGESSYQILRLLQQARSLALTQPNSASLSLLEAINLDLAEYQAIPVPNKTRILVELDDALRLAPELPRLTETEEAENTEEAPPSDYLGRMKNALASLGNYIRVYRIRNDLVLTGEEAKLVEMSLMVRILQAQLAVLQGEERFYQSTVRAARQLVEDSYPPSLTKDELVMKLSHLAEMNVQPGALPLLHSAALLAR